jgi:hypothetical protein
MFKYRLIPVMTRSHDLNSVTSAEIGSKKLITFEFSSNISDSTLKLSMDEIWIEKWSNYWLKSERLCRNNFEVERSSSSFIDLRRTYVRHFIRNCYTLFETGENRGTAKCVFPIYVWRWLEAVNKKSSTPSKSSFLPQDKRDFKSLQTKNRRWRVQD